MASMEAEWIAPWNDADVDLDVPNADPLGGVNLCQKQTRTQKALSELCNSWNEQMKTTKVSLLPISCQQNLCSAIPQSPSFGWAAQQSA